MGTLEAIGDGAEDGGDRVDPSGEGVRAVSLMSITLEPPSDKKGSRARPLRKFLEEIFQLSLVDRLHLKRSFASVRVLASHDAPADAAQGYRAGGVSAHGRRTAWSLLPCRAPPARRQGD